MMMFNFFICLIIACFIKQAFVRGFLGDVIVVGIIYYFFRIFLKNKFINFFVVLLFCYSVEIMQYFSIVKILGLSNYKIARIIIGTNFDFMDLLAYTVGGIICIILDILFLDVLINKKIKKDIYN